MTIRSSNFQVVGAVGALLTLVFSLGGCGGGSGSSGATSSNSAPRIPPVAAATPSGSVTPTPAKPLRVTCVGDSITFGEGVSNREKYAYPRVLGKSLGEGFLVSSFGYIGATMIATNVAPYWAYQRLPLYGAALASKPDILVVALGTNDAALPLDAARRARFVKDYGKFLADFRRAAPQARLYLCVPPAAYGPSLFRARNIQLWIGPLVRQVAAQNKATVIDLFTPTSGHPEMFPDSLHPNDAGASELAAEIKKALLPS